MYSVCSLISGVNRDDKTRCQTVIDKYVGYAKKHGSRKQHKEALEVMLPSSSLYDYLEGRIPQPAYTYTKVVEIVEAEERERINKEIGERRTRLGAKIGQVNLDVKREVLESSDLERLYSCIIDWTTDDDMRRIYEEKVLQRAYDTLVVIPSLRKPEKRKRVQKLAEGLVILKHPFSLAWKIVLEWKDVEKIEELDAGLLNEYTEMFPDDGLSKVIKGYLHSEASPFPKPIESGSEEERSETLLLGAPENRLFLMTEGAEESSRSVLSQRLMGEYLLYLDEYSSVVDTARKALDIMKLESEVSGIPFQNNIDGINILLATALVQHQTPRYHGEARSIFDSVLQRKPGTTSALIGVGLILEEEEDYSSAIDFLSRAQKRTTDIKVRTETAWCKALNGDYETGLHELESCLPEIDPSKVRAKDLKAQTLYRVGMCLWNLDTSRTARKDRTGAYARFLSSLQANLNYAPAYTILGEYYADYAKDKKRARKCFQKAFELSASEVEAAERLARAFADQGEWDLVEVVAQRVIESGKIRPPPGSKKKGLSWPFAAIGIVQLNNQEYTKSITSYQQALRISPGDYHSWIGLGESYHNAGRYIAATKAFEQSQKLATRLDGISSDDLWFSEYMYSNVKRELGDFEEAIVGYKNVLKSRPKEFGVSIALLQTHVDSAWRNIELGFFGQAAQGAVHTLRVGKVISDYHNEAFNLWKAIGDAFSVFSWVQSYISDLPKELACDLLETGVDLDIYEILAEADGIGKVTLRELSTSKTSPSLYICMSLAILSHKRAIHVCANDIHAQAVAWFNLGWTEYRTHTCLHGGFREHPKKKQSFKYLKTSVRCFKRAIELEAGNSEFWNALGIVTTQMNPKVSQHAFVRSLFLNEKSARVWTNLGTLCLLQNDHQLANDAFTRAQSVDPDYTHAWVGQGILAMLLGEDKESQGIFTHAFEISDSSSTITKREYAMSSFDYLLSLQTSSNQIIDVLQPLFALQQLRSQITSDVIFLHLSSLLTERVGDCAEAMNALTTVCNTVEAEYEISESPTSLAHFAQAKADLARVQLASLDFKQAAENAEIALDLSSDESSGNPDPAARQKYRLSAHLTAGLAYNYSNEADQAISMFRTALEETDSNPDIICVLAQVLWAKRGEVERTVAREQLFDCVEKHPEHIGATILLSVIALFDGDTDTIQAVADDLHELRTHDGLDIQQQRKIGQILNAFSKLIPKGESREQAEMVEATSAIMFAPFRPQGWSQLADLTEETHPADMAVLTTTGSVPPKGSLDAESLCKAYAGACRLADAQRAIVMAPWAAEGWHALAETLT